MPPGRPRWRLAALPAPAQIAAMTTSVPTDDPSLDFLRVQDAFVLRHGLRGIRVVDVRLVGPHPVAGAEIAAFLEAEGMEVSLRQIDRLMPPPLRRYVFRYSGNRAEITVAPEVSA